MNSMSNSEAVASSIADAATRFSWMESSGGNDFSQPRIETQPLANYSASYHKRSNRDLRLSNHSSHSHHGTQATDRSTLSGSSHGHSIVEMDPTQCLAALENCMVTAPNGAAGQDNFPVDWNSSPPSDYYQPHVPPKAIVTRRRASMSEMSTTSSITDFDLRPSAGSERRIAANAHDPMMDAIRQKLSTVLFKDGRQVDVDLSDEVVEALASLVLSVPKKTRRNLSTTLENQPSLEEARGSSHSRNKARAREHRSVMASSLAPSSSSNNNNVSPKRSRGVAAEGESTRAKKSSSGASCASAATATSITQHHHKQKRRSSLAQRFEKDANSSESGFDVSSTISPTDVRNPPQNRRGSMNGSTRAANHNRMVQETTTTTTTHPVVKTRRPRRSSVTTASSAEVTMEQPPRRSGGRRNSVFGSSMTGDHSVPTDRELMERGWKKAMDVGSGRYYYYSLDHSQVVWENPLALMSAPRRTTGKSAPSWNQAGSIWQNPGSLPEEGNDDDDDPFGVDPFEARF